MPPSAPRTQVPPITIKDFTPGIADEPSVSYPPGQATRTNTFRCIASPSGALQPLFNLVSYYVGLDWNGGTPEGGAYVVDGFYAAGPLIPTGGDVTGSNRPHELWLGTEYTTATDRVHHLERLLVDEDPMSRETIKTVTTSLGDEDPTVLNGWGMTFVVAAWSPPFTGVDSYVVTFPDDTVPTTNTPFDILASGTPSGVSLVDQQCLIICHQNRIIIRRETVYGHGEDQVWATTEDLFHTDANDPSNYNGPQAFVPENPDGYSVMGAMSASELFALKESGGLIIQGDIENPRVVNLPMVTGAGDGGAYTRMGFMYAGTSTGLWVWPHGDTSNHLSTLLYPDFYKIAPELLVAQRYQWDCADNYVFLSNNFVYDTDTQSFWRLDDESLYQFRFMAHRLQWLYGAVSTYVDTELAAPVVIYSYDMTVPARSFSWQSHPLWSTIDRDVDIRQLSIRASGVGTVTVTISCINAQPRSQMFEVNSNIPFLQTQNFSIKGQAMTVLIESDGDTTDAPTVYEVNLYPSDRQSIANVT